MLGDDEMTNMDNLELLAMSFGLSIAISLFNRHKNKKMLAKWREESLPAFKERYQLTQQMITKKAQERHDLFKRKQFEVVRAYYGLKTDIKKYLHLAYDDTQIQEDLGDLMIVNVTIATRFHLDTKLKGINMASTKQNLLGFFNPIPSFMPEHESPWLCIIYKRGEETFTEYFKDNQPVKILC